MIETPEVMRLAQEMARHAGARQSQVAMNIANADTPGYRALDLTPFSEAFDRTGPGVALRTTRLAHMSPDTPRPTWTTFDVGGEASPNGNTVSLEEEMVRGASAKSAHDTALAVYKSSLDLLRSALGRGR